MSEAIWYYAHGDTEQGPVTDAQIKALVTSGKLAADDLVWRDGMEDWTPARQVPELFASTPELTAPPIAERRATAGGRTRTLSLPAVDLGQPLLTYGRTFGQPLLLLGLLLVLLAKGCDTIGERYVQRLNAISEVAEERFQDQWDRRKTLLQQRQSELQQKANPTADERRELGELATDLQQLDQEMSAERDKRREGRWREQQIAARDAAADNKMWAYWRAWFFVVGTLILSTGLLATGFSGSTAERWICLIMLAMVTFSIYVGGTAWVSTLLSP